MVHINGNAWLILLEFYDFPFHIWDVILPIDELHHFSRWLKHVKTTKQEPYQQVVSLDF